MEIRVAILILANLIITGSITLDIIQAKNTERDTLHKSNYIDSLYSEEEFDYELLSIKHSSKARASLAYYYERALDLNSSIRTYDDSINWVKFLDKEDIEAFRKGLNQIPLSNCKPNKFLCNHRNNIIKSTLFKYLNIKTGVSSIGCFADSWILFKDVNNDLTLYKHSAPNKIKKSINGCQIDNYSDNPLKIPFSDTLNVHTVYYRNMPWKTNHIDSLEVHHVINLDDFLK